MLEFLADRRISFMATSKVAPSETNEPPRMQRACKGSSGLKSKDSFQFSYPEKIANRFWAD